MSLSVQLISFSDSSVPFGTTTSAPSNVVSVVARMPISRTLPEVPDTSTTSPGWIGRSNIRIRPETKLLTTFCRPKPMPMPSAPKIERELRGLEACGRQRHHQADQHQGVVAERGDAVADAARQVHLRQHFVAQDDAHRARDPERDVDRDDEQQDAAQRHRDLPDLERVGQDRLGGAENRPRDAELVQRDDDPGRPAPRTSPAC